MQYPIIGAIYRHYKSTGGEDHTYQVVGIAKHSENDEELVIYKPLYDSSHTRLGHAQFAARPIAMWFDVVERDGQLVQRFTLID